MEQKEFVPQNLTEEEKEQLMKISLRLGTDNWSFICFSPEAEVYNAYSQLDDGDALYKLILIMREMIMQAVNNFRITEGGGCGKAGSC